MAQTHDAAILPHKGGPFSIGKRPTPKPGPGEVLVEIKAVALNPVDYYQRDHGLPPVPIYPTVIGSDAAGVVVDSGDDVSPAIAPGTRVLGLISGFYHEGSPDYGAFQKYALAQSEAIVPLPDELSFEQGAMFPLTFMTALTAWTTIGIPLNTRFSPEEKQAVLIWGGASCVGTFAIQSARTLGFKVYVTASPQHHDYLKKLGADTLFDYHDPAVVSKIVDAVSKDGMTLTTAHGVVVGSLQPVLDVLKHTKGDSPAKVAYSPPLPEGHPTLENTTILFNFPPMDKTARGKHMQDCFHGWLQEGLNSGSVVPSPALHIVEGGLDGVNSGLDMLRTGVSGTKIVVPIV